MLDDPLVFWLLPASWAVHDVEEYVALPAWHARNEASLRRLARRSLVE